MKVTITSPTFNEFVEIVKLGNELEDKIKIMSIMTDCENIDSLSIDDFGILLKECMDILNDIEPKLEFTIEGKRRFIEEDITKWNFRQWVDIQSVLDNFKGEELKAAPYISYILSCPGYTSNDSEQTMIIGEKWSNMDFKLFIPVYNFFLQKENSSLETTQLCLMADHLVSQSLQDMRNSNKNGDGSTALRSYLMETYLNKIESSIYPQRKFSPISLLKSMKLLLTDLNKSIWKALTKIKDSILYLI